MRSREQATSGNTEELELLRRVAARDRDALTALFVRYHPRLFKFVFRLTSSYSIAEELVNDVMLVVWRKADTFRGESQVSTWILGIAYRLTMRTLSRNKIRPVSDLDPDDISATAGSEWETEDWVQRGIESLPAAQQTMVMLVFYLGLSYEEAAAVTDCPVNTVKSRMFHARRKLRDILAASAGTAEDTI